MFLSKMLGRCPPPGAPTRQTPCLPPAGRRSATSRSGAPRCRVEELWPRHGGHVDPGPGGVRVSRGCPCGVRTRLCKGMLVRVPGRRASTRNPSVVPLKGLQHASAVSLKPRRRRESGPSRGAGPWAGREAWCARAPQAPLLRPFPWGGELAARAVGLASSSPARGPWAARQMEGPGRTEAGASGGSPARGSTGTLPLSEVTAVLHGAGEGLNGETSLYRERRRVGRVPPEEKRPHSRAREGASPDRRLLGAPVTRGLSLGFSESGQSGHVQLVSRGGAGW